METNLQVEATTTSGTIRGQSQGFSQWRAGPKTCHCSSIDTDGNATTFKWLLVAARRFCKSHQQCLDAQKMASTHRPSSANTKRDDIQQRTTQVKYELALSQFRQQPSRKRPNNGLEFNKTLGKALQLTTLGQSLLFTHTTRKSGLEPK